MANQEPISRKKHVSWTKDKAEVCEKMYENGESTKRIAQITSMSQRSVQNYINEHISDTEGQPWIPFEPRKRSFSTRRRLLEAKLIDIIADDCTLTQQQMVDKLPDRLKVGAKTVGKTIKSLGYTRKRLRKIPVQRNTSENIQVRKAFAQKIRNYPDDKLFYLNETGFNLHTTTNYGYAISGATPSVFLEGNRRPNISVLVCISKSGVVHSKHVEGAFNTNTFLEFVEDLQEKIPNEDTLLVMDNVAFHRANVVKDALDNSGHSYQYLPPYTPELNPIEEYFALLKAEQKKIRPRPTNKQTLLTSINTALEATMRRDLTNYYKHMRSFQNKALHCQPFL